MVRKMDLKHWVKNWKNYVSVQLKQMSNYLRNLILTNPPQLLASNLVVLSLSLLILLVAFTLVIVITIYALSEVTIKTRSHNS